MAQWKTIVTGSANVTLDAREAVAAFAGSGARGSAAGPAKGWEAIRVCCRASQLSVMSSNQDLVVYLIVEPGDFDVAGGRVCLIPAHGANDVVVKLPSVAVNRAIGRRVPGKGELAVMGPDNEVLRGARLVGDFCGFAAVEGGKREGVVPGPCEARNVLVLQAARGPVIIRRKTGVAGGAPVIGPHDPRELDAAAALYVLNAVLGSIGLIRPGCPLQALQEHIRRADDGDGCGIRTIAARRVQNGGPVLLRRVDFCSVGNDTTLRLLERVYS